VKKYTVEDLAKHDFKGVQLGLFSAGGSVSKEHAPRAAEAGCIVVDNTSAFRMTKDVPLVVPEVNPEAALDHPRRIIANPNCSTIQMVVALAPIHRAATIERLVISTYQAVSGAGARAIEEITKQACAWAAGTPLPKASVFPHPIFFDYLPHIGDFRDDGYSVEERKMIDETRKILDEPSMRITATTVRVPVLIGHGESLNIELQKPLSAEHARELLSESPGVTVIDDPQKAQYPLARTAAGQDPVYVGRIREDVSVENGLAMWVVADNLRKGAALNAVQIGELLAERGVFG
jgi:aspartate-semialdehyde dehydrogenase